MSDTLISRVLFYIILHWTSNTTDTRLHCWHLIVVIGCRKTNSHLRDELHSSEVQFIDTFSTQNPSLDLGRTLMGSSFYGKEPGMREFRDEKNTKTLHYLSTRDGVSCPTLTSFLYETNIRGTLVSEWVSTLSCRSPDVVDRWSLVILTSLLTSAYSILNVHLTYDEKCEWRGWGEKKTPPQ